MSRFENGLLSAIADGAKSTFWGVVALWIGVVWGGIVAADIPFAEMDALQWTGYTALIGMLLVLFGTPWGWLFLPVLVLLFYGAIAREWNLLLVASATAVTIGTALLLVWFYWDDADCGCFAPRWIRLLYPLSLLALVLLLPRLLRLFPPRRPAPNSSDSPRGGAGDRPRPLFPPPP